MEKKTKMEKYLLYIFIIFIISPNNFTLCQTLNKRQDVNIWSDIVYMNYINSSHDTVSLKLDIYKSTLNNSKLNPVLLFVHGGGFSVGDKKEDLYVKMAMAFANHGYVSVSINYTLKGEKEPYTRNILDRDISEVLKAMQWIKVNSSRYYIDTTRVIICGDSAGGGIVVNTSFNCKSRNQFIGCIDLWGGLPGGKGWEGPIFNQNINKCVPPTCIIHGTNDSVVPFKTSQDLADHLASAGIYYELHPLEGADHFPENLSDKYMPLIISFAHKLCFQ